MWLILTIIIRQIIVYKIKKLRIRVCPTITTYSSDFCRTSSTSYCGVTLSPQSNIFTSTFRLHQANAKILTRLCTQQFARFQLRSSAQRARSQRWIRRISAKGKSQMLRARCFQGRFPRLLLRLKFATPPPARGTYRNYRGHSALIAISANEASPAGAALIYK